MFNNLALLLLSAFVGASPVHPQEGTLSPVARDTVALVEPYKLSLITNDPGVTAYVNGRSRWGKIGRPMGGNSQKDNCWQNSDVWSEKDGSECIGDVAVTVIADDTVYFDIHRDYWAANEFQQCHLKLLAKPETLRGAVIIKKGDYPDKNGVMFRVAAKDEGKVEVKCDRYKADD